MPGVSVGAGVGAAVGKSAGVAVGKSMGAVSEAAPVAAPVAAPIAGPGKIIICPTPIGNLGDMTTRAIDALRAADVIAAEDTRVTGKLLVALGIEGKRLERLDENLLAGRDDIVQDFVARAQRGEVIAYCSDAGMPGVSDPGNRLVRAARLAAPSIAVEVLPGPTAVATAFVASGTLANAFYFGGFFPRKDGQRRALLETLSGLDAALIFYESPNRLVSALEVVAETFPNREVCVCRELTKLHEEVVSGLAPQVRDEFAGRAGVKGEIVLVIGPVVAEELAESDADRREAAVALAGELLASGMRSKEVARVVANELDVPRNEAYEIVLGVRG